MSNRNSYRNWTREELDRDIRETWDRMVFNGVPVKYLVDSRTGKPVQLPFLDYTMAVERSGLKLVDVEWTYKIDKETGKPQLDENGNPIKDKAIPAPYDVCFNVKATGQVDCDGTPIPTGKAYFIVAREATNRQPKESNIEHLSDRLDHWVLTGEPLIKDEEGNGQNEQHRCLAVIRDTLEMRGKCPQEGIPVLTIDGVSLGAAGAIDTGLQKSSTDDLTSNHEILAPTLPLTRDDFANETEIGFGSDSKIQRGKICRELSGVAKRIVLRMLGTNIKGSKFDSYSSSGNVQVIADRWNGLDKLVNLVTVYVNSIPQKVDKKQNRPVKVWEVATAYALITLRGSEPIQTEADLVSYDFPEIDFEPLKAFCQELINAATGLESFPLTAWVKDRLTNSTMLHTDEQSFYEVLRAMECYLDGEVVSPEINKLKATKQTGSEYYFLGGADKGPAPKPEKKTKAKA